MGRTGRRARAIWQIFARNNHLFRGAPTQLWMDYAFSELFGLQERLSEENADAYFDQMSECLSRPEYRPRALFDGFGIELMATTEGAFDPLAHHAAIPQGGWTGTVITTYRPDEVTDPERETFAANLDRFASICGCDVSTWAGYLEAHRRCRAHFRNHGAVATDHGVPDAQTADLSQADCEALFDRVYKGQASAADAAMFRAQMLTEMARMSIEDGMTMQIHPRSVRNHNRGVFGQLGRDKGFDIPRQVDFVGSLAPLLNAIGCTRTENYRLHAGRDDIQPRVGPTGRGLPSAFHRPCLVVLRQPRRHPTPTRGGDRNGRLLQHRWLQRRHPRVSLAARTT